MDSSSNLSGQNAAFARKASLNALSAYAGPIQVAALNSSTTTVPAAKMLGGDGRELELGDTVNVPGGMHGVVKFIGSVKGKKGTFAGVELGAEYASKGKNDGHVDGVRYFTTSVPGAGIFLPLHRAAKRSSSLTADTFPPTPTTPSFAFFDLNGDGPGHKTPLFSQSVGPGMRVQSPALKHHPRPSLPRPESPQRKIPTFPAPTPGRMPSRGPGSLSKGVSGAGTPRYSPSPSMSRMGQAGSARTPTSTRPYSRSNSRLTSYTRAGEDDDNTTPTPATRMAAPNSNTPKQRSQTNDAELQRLRQKLDERDQQLKEQAASLAEMESSLSELQTLIPNDDSPISPMRSRPSALSRTSGGDSADVAELRLMLREKNEKISLLTAEFDNHRADFRSTIDTLELASTETQRVYDQRIDELVNELRDVQERGTDVDSIAQQLKQLEDLVQALEEDVEDARRGEAEARSEVEFLRGEVERGRSELKRERAKAADALKGANTVLDTAGGANRGSREVEQRDDEIRGLKAIIHSLSSAPDAASPQPLRMTYRNVAGVATPASAEVANMQSALERLEREKRELQGLVERKAFREEELERELERVRGHEPGNVAQPQQVQQHHHRVSILSDKTATQEEPTPPPPPPRDSSIPSWRHSPAFRSQTAAVATSPLARIAHSDAGSNTGTDAGSAVPPWCDMCESAGHDILSCTQMSGGNGVWRASGGSKQADDAAAVEKRDSAVAQVLPPPPPTKPPMAPLPNPFDFQSHLVAGKGELRADPAEWCALCERDGHLAMVCPFEDQF